MDYLSASLALNPPKSSSRVGIYIAPHDLFLESGLGLLFIIVEVNSLEKTTKKLIDQIINDLSSEYYQSATSDIEIALESTCQKFNENILASSGKDKKWFSKLNLLIANCRDQEIIISSFGKMSALLIRNNKTINIVDHSEISPGHKNKSFKIFSQVISGELKKDDLVILTTPSLLDYFSPEKIKKTCLSLGPKKAVESFKALLADNITPTSFGTTILKIMPEPQPQTPHNLTNELSDLYGPQTSMDQLQSLERKTGKLLTASLWPNIKIFFGKTFSLVSKLITLGKKSKLKPSASQKESAPRTTKKATKIKHAIAPLLKLTHKIKNIQRPKKTKDKKAPQAKISPQKSLDLPKKLSKTGRVYLTVTFILILAFISSIFIISRGKIKQKTLNKFNQQAEYIQEKANASEAALIYQDEDKAQKLLSEAKDTLTQLASTKISSQQARKLELINQTLEVITLKIHHLTKLERLESVANFTTLPDKPFDFKLTDFSLLPSNFYVLDNQNSLYKIDPTSQSFSPITQIHSDIQLEQINFLNDDNLIISQQDNSFINFNLPDQTSTQISATLRENSRVADWQTYSDKLYTIDHVNNQIYRFPKTSTQFSPRSAWLKDPGVQLNASGKMVIDGNIWVSLDSQIIKLFKGLKQPFEITGLEKPLGEKLKIYTHSDIDNLFILDSDNLKVIILNKTTGKVKQQFLYPDRYQLSQITSSPDGKTIYLLGQERVFKIVP